MYMTVASYARGYAAMYHGEGLFAKESAVQLSFDDSIERELISRATPTTPALSEDKSLVAFHSGAISGGPRKLGPNGSFTLEAVLPLDDVRVSIRVGYIYYNRSYFVVSRVSERGEPAFGTTAPLDADEIKGTWVGDTYRWDALEPPSVSMAVSRVYTGRKPRSRYIAKKNIVNLPLRISVDAPPTWTPGSRLYFHTGWSPDTNRRPVMSRWYRIDGSLEKVDSCLEVRQS